MVSWRVCGWCSGGRGRRQQYRYEVVYRRDDSLYSGPDYLESLPGGRASLSPAPRHPHHAHYHLHHAHPQPRHYPPPRRQRPSPPRLHPVPADAFARQNRVNHILTAFNHRQPPRRPHSAYRGPWLSSGDLGAPVAPRTGILPQWRSAPLLPPNYRDPSVSSRDLSRDTSRDISLASSSAHSTKPLLPHPHAHRPPPLITTAATPSPSKPPHSPRTPLSPGPPGYSEAFTFSPLHQLAAGKAQLFVPRLPVDEAPLFYVCLLYALLFRPFSLFLPFPLLPPPLHQPVGKASCTNPLSLRRRPLCKR